MKRIALILSLAAIAAAANAQTQPKSPASPAKPAASAASAPSATGVKLPRGVPPVTGVIKTAYSLRIEDYKTGAGPVAEPYKMYHVHYTLYLGANGRPDDGQKLDSSYDHPPSPVLGPDGRPEMGSDGKMKMVAGQPIVFPQGFGHLVPGFDQGFDGMRIGGKRRLFVPWQLAYGERGRPSNDPKHPGVPPKANLIFDVELVDVTEIPPQMLAPQMPAGARPIPHPGAGAAPGAAPATPAAPAAPATSATPATKPASSAPAQPATPAQPAATPQPQSSAPAQPAAQPQSQPQPK